MKLLDRYPIVAPPSWNRWLVPPAALAVHLSIGQVYAWSVFKTPLENSLGISGSGSALPFQIGILVLGLSAAFGGTLVERRGPRWAMLVSTICFAAGFLVSAAGMAASQYWLVVLGYGVIGGIGLGIGYISPVSTLMKWFPDRPGMATGIAIMGFGGGALIASPWSTAMLNGFGKTSGGIAATFLVHGIVYAVVMSIGVFLVRVPPEGWRPKGWNPPEQTAKAAGPRVSARNALRTPQFWLLWAALCLNVTAGIGILEKAAPMIKDFFSGTSTPVSAGLAAAFVSMLSLTNMLGRFVWSSASDAVGRKNIYRLYLGGGALLYVGLMLLGTSSVPLFIACGMLILSFYGGGFSTMPAYLKDLFGTYEVGAIHGRLLTAWSVAGVLGPLIVDALADAGKSAGKSGSDLYSVSFYIMIALLVVGFVANELIRPVDARFHEPAPAAGTGPQAETAEPAEAAEAEPAAEAESAAAEVEPEAAAAEPAEADAAEEKAKTDSPQH
ncbi:L-lactate MFS transporter [Saccharopolyspora rosea]|uniref:OFA family MFS transporter n=1 Tax=Saccharopolyspora rosea TaxID=524884 RepID=A0ABW3FVS6_9PSEU|nr:OFA family MFS transporter [Saccharopolyspora rosea]